MILPGVKFLPGVKYDWAETGLHCRQLLLPQNPPECLASTFSKNGSNFVQDSKKRSKWWLKVMTHPIHSRRRRVKYFDLTNSCEEGSVASKRSWAILSWRKAKLLLASKLDQLARQSANILQNNLSSTLRSFPSVTITWGESMLVFTIILTRPPSSFDTWYITSFLSPFFGLNTIFAVVL